MWSTEIKCSPHKSLPHIQYRMYKNLLFHEDISIDIVLAGLFMLTHLYYLTVLLLGSIVNIF